MNDIVPIYIPRDNVNDETVMILEWHVKDGDAVSAGQPLVEVETSKAAFEIESPRAGVVKRTAPSEGEVAIGEVLCYIGETLSAVETHLADKRVARPIVASAVAPTQPVAGAPIRLAPAPPAHGRRFSHKAEELIRSRGLRESDLAYRGLIRAQDILLHLGEIVPQPTCDGLATMEAEPASRVATGVAVRSETLPRAKRLEAKLLSWSHRHALRSVVTTAVPARGLWKLKKEDPKVAEQLSAAVIYECGRLLRKYPYLNACCDSRQVSFYEQVNIGYALDVERGLKVPVVRNADTKSMTAIIDERRLFLVDYLNDELRPEAMAGATFTVTDLSGEDVFLFDPLIVEGQAAILGVGGELARAGVAESFYNLILAFDHRLAEGRMAARFLGELKERLLAHQDAIAKSAAEALPRREPCCSRCLIVLSEIHHLGGHLLQIVDNPEGKASLVCSICLTNW